MENILNTIVKCINPECQGMMLVIDASIAEDESLICSFCKSKVEVMPDEEDQERNHMPHIEMLDTTVLFYEGGRVVEEILLTDIYKQGFTFEEYCKAQAIQGREAYMIKEGSDGSN